jgi:hypothetical protein
MGRFLPPDHAAGDERTVGGYAAVHGRPAALEGPDGYAYSVEAVADRTGDEKLPWGGYLMFLRWRRIGAQGVEGHLETEFLARSESEGEALAAVRGMLLEEAEVLLHGLVRRRQEEEGGGGRRWWDVMRDEDGA